VRPLRIVWLCHYFAPEIGAPQARLLEMSREFLARGHAVEAVTCFPNHPTGVLAPSDRRVRKRTDVVEGVTVERCWSFVTPNKGFVKKTLGHLSFMVTGWGGLSRAARRGRPDVVLVSSPTFFSVITAWLWCGVRGVPWVFEVRDLWPGVFVELGVLRNRLLIAILEWMELFLYRRASRVVVVTRSFADDIARRGIDRAKIGVVTNGVDHARFAPGEPAPDFLREESLDGRFVVLYLGAHGISHALGRILDAAALLRDLPDVLFVFVGEGAEKEALVRDAASRGLSNVRFVAGVPKERVVRWYRAAHVGLVPLRKVELFKTFIPSKMFELLASGLPIVGSVDGEARAILEESGGAVVVGPEDADAIAKAVRALRDDPERRRRMAEAGRAFAVSRYGRDRLAEDYLAQLAPLAAGGRA
jgi:glycosyltransferase involved in cell wall biosynthesis